jgi:hypothetical protein
MRNEWSRRWSGVFASHLNERHVRAGKGILMALGQRRGHVQDLLRLAIDEIIGPCSADQAQETSEKTANVHAVVQTTSIRNATKRQRTSTISCGLDQLPQVLSSLSCSSTRAYHWKREVAAVESGFRRGFCNGLKPEWNHFSHVLSTLPNPTIPCGKALPSSSYSMQHLLSQISGA